LHLLILTKNIIYIFGKVNNLICKNSNLAQKEFGKAYSIPNLLMKSKNKIQSPPVFKNMKIRVNILINAKINKTLQFVVDLRAFA